MISFTKLVMVLCAVGMMVTGCGSNSSNQNASAPGSVTGKIVEETSGSGIPSVSVSLLNAAFKPYTSAAALATFGSYSAMNNANRAAIVATATTGSDGTYAMPNIPPGNYYVIPMVGKNKITPIGTATLSVAPITPITFGNMSSLPVPIPVAPSSPTATSSLVTVGGNAAAVMNFTEAIFASATPFTNQFVINVTFKHLPHISSGQFIVIPYRKFWYFFVPEYYGFNLQFSGYSTVSSNQSSQNITAVMTTNTTPTPTVTVTASYGYTTLLYTIDNCFYFNVTYINDGFGCFFNTPDISLPLTATPAISNFTYDFATDLVTQQ